MTYPVSSTASRTYGSRKFKRPLATQQSLAFSDSDSSPSSSPKRSDSHSNGIRHHALSSSSLTMTSSTGPAPKGLSSSPPTSSYLDLTPDPFDFEDTVKANDGNNTNIVRRQSINASKPKKPTSSRPREPPRKNTLKRNQSTDEVAETYSKLSVKSSPVGGMVQSVAPLKKSSSVNDIFASKPASTTTTTSTTTTSSKEILGSPTKKRLIDFEVSTDDTKGISLLDKLNESVPATTTSSPAKRSVVARMKSRTQTATTSKSASSSSSSSSTFSVTAKQSNPPSTATSSNTSPTKPVVKSRTESPVAMDVDTPEKPSNTNTITANNSSSLFDFGSSADKPSTADVFKKPLPVSTKPTTLKTFGSTRRPFQQDSEEDDDKDEAKQQSKSKSTISTSTTSSTHLPKRTSHTPMMQHSAAITYGASTRAFKDDGPDDDLGLSSNRGGSWNKGKVDEGLESSDEEDGTGEDGTGTGGGSKESMKKVFELKESGETKRFSDEMEFLLDGLKTDQSIGIRRSSCLDLCRKFLSGSFAMKVRAHNFIHKIYTLLRGSDDAVLLASLSFLIMILSQDKHNVDLLLHEESNGFLELVSTIMKMKDPFGGLDTAATKKIGFGITNRAKEKKMMTDLRDLIASSPLYKGSTTPVSTETMSIFILNAIVSAKPRIFEETIRDYVGSSGALKILCGWYCTRMSRFIDNHDQSELRILEKYLRVFEFGTLCHGGNQKVITESEGMLEGLVDCLRLLGEYVSLQPSPIVTDTLLAVIRVLINITNDHSTKLSSRIDTVSFLETLFQLLIWATTTTATTGEHKPGLHNFDIVLLTIGLLVNLTEVDPTIRSIHLSKLSLKLDGATTSALDVLVRIYTSYAPPPKSSTADDNDTAQEQQEQEQPSDSAENGIISAYLAVLIGCLIRRHDGNRKTLFSILSKSSSPLFKNIDSPFAPFVHVLEEFISFQQVLIEEEVLTDNTGGGNGGNSRTGENATGEGRAKETMKSFLDVLEVFKKG